MSQNDINPANEPKPTFVDTVNINKIGGKTIFVTGYASNLGKPNDYTKPEDINEDGLTEYRSITTTEVFDLELKGETKPISNFFVTKAIAKQLSKYTEDLKGGKRFGPVQAVKRPLTDNPTQSYWTLAYENDPDYKAE